MDLIPSSNVVHKLQKKSLLNAINCVAGLAILFFGYDQGMMGGVNNAPDYYQKTVGVGYPDPSPDPYQHGSPVITKPLLQGGIVSIYYLGTLMGCLVGGSFGDRYGRIKTIGLGAFWAVIGATLQCSAMNAPWMICGMSPVFQKPSRYLILMLFSSSYQRLGHWHSELYCSSLGNRNR